MYYKKLVLAGLAALFTLHAHAQKQPGISGQVRDVSGRPVPSATVTLEEPGLVTQADADGIFRMEPPAPGEYTLMVSSLGYDTLRQRVRTLPAKDLVLELTLREKRFEIEEVTVTGKSKTQEIRESGFSVNVIDTRQFANTTADINQVLNRSTGIRIREQGGLGSNFNFSINGLSGKAVKYFIDGVPLELMGSAVSLNNIPVNLAERIEVYKGVVPVGLGSDAMGGAVNLITNQQIKNYLDISHSYGSFNTHRSSLSGQLMHQPTGIILRANGFFNYSDNNYLMKEVEVLEGGQRQGKEITDLTGAAFVRTDARRFHDNYRSVMGQVEVGVANKPFADALFAGFGYSGGIQDLQTGFEQTIVYGCDEGKQRLQRYIAI